MTRAYTSPAMQDYLKQIYLLEGEAADAGIQTKALASRLEVSAASATNMLKRLARLGLVEHTPYSGAVLTPAGRRIALEVLRHHRLLETYLAEALGVPWDKVHAEAEVLEHFISEDLEERMAALLGHPTEDPHGHPIPGPDLADPARGTRRLTDLAENEEATVASVSDRDPALLRYLGERGVVPGARVRTTSVDSFGGSLELDVAGEGCSIGRAAAERVFIHEDVLGTDAS